MTHDCLAISCTTPVPTVPGFPIRMCQDHWLQVPIDLRTRIWAEYTPGQEFTDNPSIGYQAAAFAAIRHLEYIEFAR